ncbi:PREDICTED: protein FAM208B-like [Propithecus coquereli]|uniref:protein FAM208B-like n=1 Tax=Propithecus coquereli TaxID=379532 RepID=UPI00063F18C0|nr:PREDICTED: protein FAM208B-like [Propithecus coquereli]
MAAPARESILELSENVLRSPWKGRLTIQGCVLCDITLWPTYGTVLPTQLPQELDFKYAIKVSSLKKRLPEAAFRKQNYLEQKVCCQSLCFNLYEVELSNRQGEKIDKLTEYIKKNQLGENPSSKPSLQSRTGLCHLDVHRPVLKKTWMTLGG